MLYVFSCRTLLMALIAFVFTTLSSPYAFTSVLPQTQNVSSGVLSYREWKNAKIAEAQTKIKNLKEKIITDPNLPIKNAGTEAGLSKDLEREKLNLSLTQDLTISDYFVGYLTRQSSMDSAIKDVSQRLTSEEVAELMSAYAENFFQSKPPALNPGSTADLVQ